MEETGHVHNSLHGRAKVLYHCQPVEPELGDRFVGTRQDENGELAGRRQLLGPRP